MNPTRLTAALASALLLAAGCGSSNRVWATGKVIKGGSNYVPPKGEHVDVTLIAIDVPSQSDKAVHAGDQFSADVDDEKGTFVIRGSDGEGIPPGKYRVAVTQKMSREAFDAAYPKPAPGITRETDRLDNRYGPETSSIIREVKTSGELVIDLDHPSG
jgi:hypothetical protein